MKKGRIVRKEIKNLDTRNVTPFNFYMTVKKELGCYSLEQIVHGEYMLYSHGYSNYSNIDMNSSIVEGALTLKPIRVSRNLKK